jgi:hypothetical protein
VAPIALNVFRLSNAAGPHTGEACGDAAPAGETWKAAAAAAVATMASSDRRRKVTLFIATPPELLYTWSEGTGLGRDFNIDAR